MWGDLLLKLNKIVAALLENKTHIPPIANRLADFTVFCKRISKSGVLDENLLLHGLRSLVDRQRIVLMESSPLISVLDEWLASEDSEIGKFHTFQQFFTITSTLARARKLEWRWVDAKALERHIMALKDPLKKLYGAEFQEAKDASGKSVTKIKFIRL